MKSCQNVLRQKGVYGHGAHNMMEKCLLYAILRLPQPRCIFDLPNELGRSILSHLANIQNNLYI